MSAFALIAIGGGIGAGLRWLVVYLIPAPPNGYPIAITVVNVVGSFVLGLVVGAGVESVGSIDIDAGTIGVLGGFTTFSTWMVDIDRADVRRESAVIAFVPIALGFMAAIFGVLAGALVG